MILDAEICQECAHVDVDKLTLRRCWRCRRFGCQHKVSGASGQCKPVTKDCCARYEDYVAATWIEELRRDGYCVTPSGRVDGHMRYVSHGGKCAFCGKSE